MILANLLKINHFYSIDILKEIRNWVRKETKTRREKDLKRLEFITRRKESSKILDIYLDQKKSASDASSKSNYGDSQIRESKNERKRREKKEKKKEVRLDHKKKNDHFMSKNERK